MTVATELYKLTDMTEKEYDLYWDLRHSVTLFLYCAASVQQLEEFRQRMQRYERADEHVPMSFLLDAKARIDRMSDDERTIALGGWRWRADDWLGREDLEDVAHMPIFYGAEILRTGISPEQIFTDSNAPVLTFVRVGTTQAEAIRDIEAALNVVKHDWHRVQTLGITKDFPAPFEPEHSRAEPAAVV